jgi:hypothetical protein
MNLEMRTMKKRSIIGTLAAVFMASALFAGNPQRVGSAAAFELLINPWARSAGWGGSNISAVRGLESSYLNVAGLAFTSGTEVMFSNTQWLMGSDISINTVGLSQRVSDGGVLALSLTSFDYGEWDITTVNQPEGGVGTIAPSSIVLGISYAQKFTNTIYGGVTIKAFNQSINNLSGSAIMADAGVQYITGEDYQIKFGVTLKNVGSNLIFEGDGNAITLPVPQGGYSQSYEQLSSSFELPSQLSLGASYDFLFTDGYRMTPALSFQSNSFEKDVFTGGLEFAWKQFLMVRAGYAYFDNRVDNGQKTTALTGMNYGLTFRAPLSKGSSSYFGLDYAYRATNPFNGIHTLSVQFDL